MFGEMILRWIRDYKNVECACPLTDFCRGVFSEAVMLGLAGGLWRSPMGRGWRRLGCVVVRRIITEIADFRHAQIFALCTKFRALTPFGL